MKMFLLIFAAIPNLPFVQNLGLTGDLFDPIPERSLSRSDECEQVRVNIQTDRQNIAHATATTSCSFSQNLDVDTIYSSFLESLRRNGTIESENDNGNSISLIYEDDTYNTGHGTISALFDSTLSKNNSSIKYSARSREIHATSYAASTQNINIDITFTLSESSIDVMITRKVAIKKPSFDPFGQFEGKTREGMVDQMEKLISDLIKGSL